MFDPGATLAPSRTLRTSLFLTSALASLLVTPVHAQSPAEEDLQFLDGTAVPDAELHGGYPFAHDARGISVACSADGATAIVGAMRGGARIFTRGDHGWILEHEVRPATERAEAQTSVAMSADGSSVLISAPTERAGGLVAVLVRHEWTWADEATLRASDAARGDRFGASVAMSANGSRILVGAPGDDTTENDTGSARVFVRSGRAWIEEATLLAADGARRDEFGASVALSADGLVALIGAPGDDVDEDEDAGSAHVFVRTVAGWSDDRTLPAGGLARRDRLGTSVTLSGDGLLAIVGAPGEDVDHVQDIGSVRIFSSDAVGGWSRDAFLTTMDASTMGAAVAIAADGATALVAGRGDRGRRGVVRVLVRSAEGWSASSRLDAREDGRGVSLALSGDGRHALIGAPGADVDGVSQAGTALAYRLVHDADPADGWQRTEPLVVGPRYPSTAREGRTPEQEAQLRDGSIGCFAIGAVLAAGGLVTVLVTLLVGLGTGTFSSPGSDSLAGVIAGGTVLGVGVILLVTGGVLRSYTSPGGLRPQLVLAPTVGGASASLTLRF